VADDILLDFAHGYMELIMKYFGQLIVVGMIILTKRHENEVYVQVTGNMVK
jgi:hypothetical protein